MVRNDLRVTRGTADKYVPPLERVTGAMASSRPRPHAGEVNAYVKRSPPPSADSAAGRVQGVGRQDPLFARPGRGAAQVRPGGPARGPVDDQRLGARVHVSCTWLDTRIAQG